MVIIQTNGVSFALVAGAICIVKMSNITSKGSTWTMNINSTGAKTVNTYDTAGTWTSPETAVYPSTDTRLTTALPLLFGLVYDGSAYALSTNDHILPYPDYSD